MIIPQYAIYYTAVTDSHPVGYVHNCIVWDGSPNWSPPSGSAAVQDNAGKYPIGSVYSSGASTYYSLKGYIQATAGTAITLTLVPNGAGPASAVTVTLSDGGAGGTFSATAVDFAVDSTTAQTVTYTPKAAGSVTISATNDGGLTNPTALALTVSGTSS